MRRLILLVGLHKTGTTSIQKTFARNVDALRQANFSYPLVTSVRHGRFKVVDSNHSELLLGAFRHSARQPSSAQFSQALPALVNIDSRDLILAAEGVSLLKVDELQALKAFFQEHGFSIEAYGCIRPVSSWFTSLVAQKVYGARSARWTLAAAVQGFSEGASPVARIRALEQGLGAIHWYPFAEAAAHPLGPAGHFADLIGVRIRPVQHDLQANAGGTDIMVRLHDEINREMGMRMPANDLAYQALMTETPRLFEAYGSRFELRENEVGAVAEALHRENEWLKAHHGEAFGEASIRFRAEPLRLSPADCAHLQEVFRTGPAQRAAMRLIEKHAAA